MERLAKQREETRQHSAANDNGGHLVSLGRILVDPRLVAALDVWVEAQQEQSLPVPRLFPWLFMSGRSVWALLITKPSGC